MQRKWFVLFATLVLFSLLIAPLGPAGAQGPLPPPSPEKLSPEIEQARARQSMEAVLAKYLAYWGPRYQLSLGEVTVESEWAHAVTEWQSEAKTLSSPIHILAHRLPDGTWQALLPETDGAYLQWLEAIPESLVPAGEKSQLRAQATEADMSPQPTITTVVSAPEVVTEAPPSLAGEIGILSTAVQVLSGDGNYFLKVDLDDPRVHVRTMLANNDAGGYQYLSGMRTRLEGQGYAEWATVNADLFGSGCPLVLTAGRV